MQEEPKTDRHRTPYLGSVALTAQINADIDFLASYLPHGLLNRSDIHRLALYRGLQLFKAEGGIVVPFQQQQNRMNGNGGSNGQSR